MLETKVLISMKLKRKSKFKDVEVCIKEGAIKTVELIDKFTDKSEIAAIVGFNSNIIREDFAERIDY